MPRSGGGGRPAHGASAASPWEGEAVAKRLKGVPTLKNAPAGDFPADWTEAQRLTQQHIEATRANNPKGQLDALIKLAEHYDMFPDVAPRRPVGA